MKSFKYISLLLICFLFTVSCDDSFDEINTNAVDPTQIDQVFILNSAMIGASYSNGPLIYEMGIVQQIITPNSGVLTGANYNQDNRNATESMWNDYFVTVIRDTRDLINQVEGEPSEPI